MRYSLLVGVMLLFPVAPARGQVTFQFGFPSVQIGISQPVFPQLVLVPGYPVYYDPYSSQNYFFYDGVYWVFSADNWYASDWYDGPWSLVPPDSVPLFVLRVPVRYYRAPPTYFSGWYGDAPPRWGARWGNDWDRSHRGWERWSRNEAPPPAPLPLYQRQYTGQRYPRPNEQRVLRGEQYRHDPRDSNVRRVFEAHEQGQRRAPASAWSPNRAPPAPSPARNPPRTVLPAPSRESPRDPQPAARREAPPAARPAIRREAPPGAQGEQRRAKPERDEGRGPGRDR